MTMTVSSLLDVRKIRQDFPLLKREMNGKPLVYLDNAATSQKPFSVINRISDFYKNEYATVHRGVYALSQDSTIECELVREKCREFLNAAHKEEIIFVKGATEAINLVATSFARKFLKKGDEIIISTIEHHANIVPWQQVCLEKESLLKVIPVNDRGEIILEEYKKLLNSKTKIVAIGHISNALGTIHPVREMIEMAHAQGAIVLVDGAQSAAHLPIDVQSLDCDFYCFSSHKVYGPTGVGVLYGKKALLERMNPYQFGGDMIEQVSFEQTTFAKIPAKFEAGTPAIAEIVGLGAALHYVEKIGFEKIMPYEHELLEYATKKLQEINGLTIIGTATKKASIISFVMNNIHPHDIGTILDQQGVAIRAGHHCAQPTMKRFGIAATARASFAFYNTKEEIDVLMKGLHKAEEIFK